MDNAKIKKTPLQLACEHGCNMTCGMESKQAFTYLVSEKLDLKANYSIIKKVLREKLILAHPLLGYGKCDEQYFYFNDDAVSIEYIENMDEGDIEEIREKLFDEFCYKNNKITCLYFINHKKRNYLITLTDGRFFDGKSQEILIAEIEKIINGEDIEREEGFIVYANSIEEGVSKEAIDFYSNIELESIDNPGMRLLKDIDSINSAHTYKVNRKIDFIILEKIEKIAKEQGITKFSLLLAIYLKVISLYCNNNNYFVSVPCMDRKWNIKEIKPNSIGFFANSYVFPYSWIKDEGLMALARRTMDQLMELGDIYDESYSTAVLKHLRHITGRNIETKISFTDLTEHSPSNKMFKKIGTRVQTSQLWIEAIMANVYDGVEISFTCIEELIDKKLSNRIADSFIEALIRISNKNYEVCLPKWDEKIIEKINNYRKDKSPEEYTDSLRLGQIINRRFSEYYDKVAIYTENNSFSYKELQNMCYALMNYYSKINLFSRNENPRIGILLNKSFKQIVIANSALLSNVSYMPIETTLSAEDINECYVKGNLSMIITEDEFIEKVKINNIAHININDFDFVSYRDKAVRLSNEAEERLQIDRKDEDVPIIINTSGTTGKPKSVCLSEKGLINCLFETKDLFGISQNDTAIALTNICHDMAIFDTIGMFFVGGSVVSLDESNQMQPEKWIELIKENNVTTWISVPAFMDMLLTYMEQRDSEQLLSIKNSIIGGDFISVKLANKMRRFLPQNKLISVGGPTETTMWNIFHVYTKSDDKLGFIPYGRPISNAKYYILNDDMELCPVGVQGTMYVSGDCLTLGYSENEEETNRKYIYWKGKRLYNTGDLGEYMESGYIKICGRADYQVKINGKRIELSGIEQVILENNYVNSAVVVVNNHTKKHVAFCVMDESYKKLLEDYLDRKLPKYMQPSCIICLEEMPLTKNEKIDRKRLMDYELSSNEKTIEINNEIVEKLIEITREVLSDCLLDEDLNFYMMGGDSISSLIVSDMIFKEFGVLISITDMLMQPTLFDWAEIIKEKQCEKQNNEFDLIFKEIFNEAGVESGKAVIEYENYLRIAESIADETVKRTDLKISKYDVLANPYEERLCAYCFLLDKGDCYV